MHSQGDEGKSLMLILNEDNRPVDKVTSFIWKRVDRERMTTTLRLGGRLIAYLPHAKRAYYLWLMAVSYRPSQHISVYQFSPPHLRVALFGRWEFGLILGYWFLGLRLGQPLFWLKRIQIA
jgi:hypothetical protein